MGDEVSDAEFIALAQAQAGRLLVDPEVRRDRHGRRHVLEESAVVDEVAAELSVIVGGQGAGELWQGHDMTQVGQGQELVGTINFFNVDGVRWGAAAMEQVVHEGMHTRCLVQGVADHRADKLSCGGKVEYAFKQVYGRNDVRFSHTCVQRRLPGQPVIGECSVAVMPELRARAQRSIRDRRGWGRYAGYVLEGRVEASVKRRTAVIIVYAACGVASAAGEWQQERIAMAANAGEHTLHGKSPFSVLLHDLTQEMDSLRKTGCTFIIGGDWNQRHDARPADWARLQRWRRKHVLGDALRHLHPGTDFVTSRCNTR